MEAIPDHHPWAWSPKNVPALWGMAARLNTPFQNASGRRYA
jgi:hypothetical protein